MKHVLETVKQLVSVKESDDVESIVIKKFTKLFLQMTKSIVDKDITGDQVNNIRVRPNALGPVSMRAELGPANNDPYTTMRKTIEVLKKYEFLVDNEKYDHSTSAILYNDKLGLKLVAYVADTNTRFSTIVLSLMLKD